MAVYASTVTLDTDRAERISRNFGMAMGKCDLTNYNTTGAEITDLTKWFQTIKRVIVDGFSTNGYMVRWNTTDKCFHAYYPSKAITPAGTNAAATITLSATHAGNAVELSANSNDAALGEAGGTGYTGITGVQAAAFTGTAVDAQAGTEVANDVAIGEFNFVAFGLL